MTELQFTVNAPNICKMARESYWFTPTDKEWSLRLLSRILMDGVPLSDARKMALLMGDAYLSKDNQYVEDEDAEWKTSLIDFLVFHENLEAEVERQTVPILDVRVDSMLWNGYKQVVKVYRDFLFSQGMDPAVKAALMAQRGIEFNFAIERFRKCLHDLIIMHCGCSLVQSCVEWDGEPHKPISEIDKRMRAYKDSTWTLHSWAILDKDHPDYWRYYNEIQAMLDREVKPEAGIRAYQALDPARVRSLIIRVAEQVLGKYGMDFEVSEFDKFRFR